MAGYDCNIGFFILCTPKFMSLPVGFLRRFLQKERGAVRLGLGIGHTLGFSWISSSWCCALLMMSAVRLLVKDALGSRFLFEFRNFEAGL